eukprot:975862-Pleurochrysis_carterae.AAC.2
METRGREREVQRGQERTRGERARAEEREVWREGEGKENKAGWSWASAASVASNAHPIDHEQLPAVPHHVPARAWRELEASDRLAAATTACNVSRKRNGGWRENAAVSWGKGKERE